MQVWKGVAGKTKNPFLDYTVIYLYNFIRKEPPQFNDGDEIRWQMKHD